MSQPGQALTTQQQNTQMGATIPETYAELKDQALMLLKSGMLPLKFSGKPEAVVITMLYGKELGLTPLQAVKEIHVINNVPSMSANLMLTLVRQRLKGFQMQVMLSNAKVCRIQHRRTKEEDWQVSEYTIEEANAAGLLNKDVWKKHAADMLFARNASRVCRQNYSDVFNGSIYTPEELEHTLVKEVAARAEAVDVVKPVDGDVVNEGAVMDLVAALLEVKDARAAEQVYNDFCVKQENSPLTIAAGWDAYQNQLQRLK
jgi:hypothetical protein